MNFNSVIAATSNKPVTEPQPSQQALGQSDFLRLLTTQMSMQDPFDPVDNKEMIAQMAQFSSLAGLSDINSTLKAILTKLDAVLSAQAATTTTTTTTTTEQTTGETDTTTDPAATN